MNFRYTAIAACVAMAPFAMAQGAGNTANQSASATKPTPTQSTTATNAANQTMTNQSSSAGTASATADGTRDMSASSGAHRSGSMSGSSGNSGMHDASTVRHVQQQLTNRGYDPGPIDGQWGPRTEAALAEFQRSQGMSPSGMDSATLGALGVNTSSGGTSPGNSSAVGEGTLGSSPNQQQRGNTTTTPR